MNNTCATCRAGRFDGPAVTFGVCCLHPPTFVVFASGQSTYVFPEIDSGTWCLDWQAKEKPKAAGTLPALTSEFEQFWAEYPRRIGKKAAQKAFQNARDRPRIDDLLEAIRKAKRSPQWLKDGGQFIPHPATWLNRGQWADVPVESKPSVFEEFLARGGDDE